MTEEINPQIKKENKYENTVFKSGYWYGGQHIQLFVNYDVGGHGSYSFLIKRGNITLISNLQKDEKLSLLRALLSKCSVEELHKLGFVGAN